MKQNCPMCRAKVAGGEDGCQKLFERVLAKEYSDPAYGAVHLLTVDCYALQHSEAHRPHSNAFHLLRLGWILERDGNAKIGKTELDFKRCAKGLRNFPFLDPPKDRGRITIADIPLDKGAAEHVRRVAEWARAVWETWEAHHQWVRERLCSSKS
jgi:hypothetical protein